VDTGLRQIDRLTAELDPLRRQLEMYSRRQGGCAALRRVHFGIGAVTSVAIWAELGDVRRFTSSDDVVRHTGLGHHRALLRHQAAPREAIPPGAAAAALGAV
jgi:transposase